MKFIDADAHANIGNLTPADNEVLLDKTNKRLVIGDGETQGGVQNSTIPGYYRTTTTKYRRYYHLAVGALNSFVSGATAVAPDANTIGGWQLNAAGEKLYLEVDVHADWDGVSDMTVELKFECSTDNTGGGDADTVDLKLDCFYKGNGEVATKNQTLEVATVIGKSAQYKMFSVEFTIDHDKVDNVVEAGDKLHMILNLETDTSEVDDIVICAGSVSFFYNTTHVGIEAGDV